MRKLHYNIRSSKDARRFSDRIDILKIQLTQFEAITIRKLANSIIVDQIHKRMRSFNFSEKIVVNTIVSSIDIVSRTKIRLHFTSTLFSETGFDVAVAREKGTKDHMIKPRWKKVLRWIEMGVVKFSKGHKVSGMKALHIIADTLDEYEGMLQKQFNDEVYGWAAKNLVGATRIANR